jgi:hypothetical protein
MSTDGNVGSAYILRAVTKIRIQCHLSSVDPDLIFSGYGSVPIKCPGTASYILDAVFKKNLQSNKHSH